MSVERVKGGTTLIHQVALLVDLAVLVVAVEVLGEEALVVGELINWVKSIFAWKEVHISLCYSYQENEITGSRRVRGGVRGGYIPYNKRWLSGGGFHYMPPLPNSKSAIDI